MKEKLIVKMLPDRRHSGGWRTLEYFPSVTFALIGGHSCVVAIGERGIARPTSEVAQEKRGF